MWIHLHSIRMLNLYWGGIRRYALKFMFEILCLREVFSSLRSACVLARRDSRSDNEKCSQSHAQLLDIYETFTIIN